MVNCWHVKCVWWGRAGRYTWEMVTEKGKWSQGYYNPFTQCKEFTPVRETGSYSNRSPTGLERAQFTRIGSGGEGAGCFSAVFFWVEKSTNATARRKEAVVFLAVCGTNTWRSPVEMYGGWPPKRQPSGHQEGPRGSAVPLPPAPAPEERGTCWGVRWA